MMKVAAPTKKQLAKVLLSNTAIASPPTRMALSSPIKRPTLGASGQLTQEQVDALVNKLRDRTLARQFLMDAGLIDEDGQLARPYRSQDAEAAK
jgi:hypothetical protein